MLPIVPPINLSDNIRIRFRSIHANAKEYGYGQSLLYDGQLVFHTPPYSLQPVSLQDGNESIGKANIRIIRPPSAEHHGASGAPDMRRSPMPHHRIIGDLSPQPLPPPLPVSSTVMIPLSKTASGDRVDRHSSYTAKMNHSNNGGGGSCSPSTLERRSRRFSSANSRQNINSHEVPYARLLDSPSRITKPKEPMSGGMMAMSVADTRVSPTMSMRQPMQLPYHQQQYPHDGLMTPRALRIPTSKTSASDSKLTVDYFQPEPVEHVAGVSCVMPDEMSHSAPQPHPLESDSDPSLSPKMLSEDEIVREVCDGVVVAYHVPVGAVWRWQSACPGTNPLSSLIAGPAHYFAHFGESLRGVLLRRRGSAHVAQLQSAHRRPSSAAASEEALRQRPEHWRIGGRRRAGGQCTRWQHSGGAAGGEIIDAPQRLRDPFAGAPQHLEAAAEHR